MSRWDAIVIGAGTNGLTAAATLARARRRVCVLERSECIGGMARTARIDGVEVPEIAHLLYNLSPKALKATGIDGRLALRPMNDVALCPEGRHAVFDGTRLRDLEGKAHVDAAAFEALHMRLCRFAGILVRLADRAPPELNASLSGLGDLGALLRTGFDFRRLGKAEARELLRILLSNAHDLLLDELPDGPIAGMLAADAVRGTHMGPRSPGTVFSLLYRFGRGGRAQWIAGGMGRLAEALADSARTAGAEIRTATRVASVMANEDRVVGVRLESGEELAAPLVLSSLAAPVSMQLAGVEQFDVEAVRRLRSVRAKGNVAKLNLVLSGLPDVPHSILSGRMVVAPTVSEVERAFNPVKYGESSSDPVIEAIIPTVHETENRGRHVLSACIQYVPHEPAGGWSDTLREEVRERALDRLETVLPGVSARVEEAQLLTPADIEARTGAPGGHWHHGELSFDQLLTVRPVNGLGNYRFGPRGYFLCGASTHPGGDVTGAPGHNAARAALEGRS